MRPREDGAPGGTLAKGLRQLLLGTEANTGILRLRGSQNAVSHFAQDDVGFVWVEETSRGNGNDSDNGNDTTITTKTKACWGEVYIPTHRKSAMNGAPDAWGCWKFLRTAT